MKNLKQTVIDLDKEIAKTLSILATFRSVVWNPIEAPNQKKTHLFSTMFEDLVPQMNTSK